VTFWTKKNTVLSSISSPPKCAKTQQSAISKLFQGRNPRTPANMGEAAYNAAGEEAYNAGRG